MRNPDFFNNEYYHIYNRGVDKRSIFQDEFDYKNFLESLHLFNDSFFTKPTRIEQRVLKLSLSQDFDFEREHYVDVCAYTLIPNHYHLLVQQLKNAGISKLMHKLDMAFSHRFNQRNDRSGTLFEGEFKAVHVSREAHLMYLIPYIHLNILDLTNINWREGLVEDWEAANRFMENYSWSSHGAYIGKQQYLPIVKDEVIKEFYKDADDYLSHLRGWSQRQLLDHLAKLS